ncbi:MAG: N-6 DNA methylase [Candidatus Bathyarchaeota archaeon]|nr:N-6 DNA methylase [Candidatus Bathyarchaeota archaeon]
MTLLLEDLRVNRKMAASLSKTLRHDRKALLQLLLSLCRKNTLRRIVRCPTYPVRTITSDLDGRLRLFHNCIAHDPYAISNVLALLFESAVEKHRRKFTGQYFTPWTVAKHAVGLLKLKNGDTILDPGCGTGIFPLAILSESFRSNGVASRDSLTYLGIENDPSLALSAAISLDWVEAPMNWRVLYANFLKVDPVDLKKAFGARFSIDAIIANPPYIRHNRLGRRKDLAKRLNLSKQSGLHSFFLAHSKELLRKGRMVFIIPMEMVESRYGSTLLERLQREFLFRSIVVYQNHERNIWNTEELGHFRLEKHSEVRRAWTLALFEQILSADRERQLHGTQKRKRKAEVFLDDIAFVHRGISTGANEFFVLTDMEARTMELHGTEYIKRVMPTRIRKNELPAVLGKDHWNSLKASGKPCWLLCLPRKRPDKLPSNIREYIRKGERNGINLIPTCAARKPWWYHIKIHWQTAPDLLFTYMSRGYPRFMYNKARVYNLTNLLGIWLRESARFSDEEVLNIVEQLNTALKKWIDQEAVGRKYRGGLVKFEPGDLKNMPISELKLTDREIGPASLQQRLR